MKIQNDLIIVSPLRSVPKKKKKKQLKLHGKDIILYQKRYFGMQSVVLTSLNIIIKIKVIYNEFIVKYL